MDLEKTETTKTVSSAPKLEKKAVAKEPEQSFVTYRSTRPGLIITLKNAKRVLYDGEPISQEAIEAQFKDGMFTTENKDIIEGIDNLIYGRHAAAWARLITKDPPLSVIRKAGKTSMKIAQAQKDAVAKVLAEEKEEDAQAYTAFQEYQKRLQGTKKPKVFSGMRG